MTEKTILVIGRSFHPDGKETAKLIAGALALYAEELGYQVKYLALHDIVFDISSDTVSVTDGNGLELRGYASVLLTNWFSHASIRKDIAHSLGLYFEYNNVPYFNKEAVMSRSTSKLSQLIQASYAGVPIARTIFSLSFDSAIDRARRLLSEPFIIKDAQASRGKGNYLVQNFDESMEHKHEHTEKNPFLVQEFIKSNGSDYRFFVAGGDKLVIHRRAGNDSHLNNTSAGGTAELTSLHQFDETVVGYVEAMSAKLGRGVTGIDIMFDQGNRPYFLEANPIPQIATGSFTQEKLSALANALVSAAENRR